MSKSLWIDALVTAAAACSEARNVSHALEFAVCVVNHGNRRGRPRGTPARHLCAAWHQEPLGMRPGVALAR